MFMYGSALKLTKPDNRIEHTKNMEENNVLKIFNLVFITGLDSTGLVNEEPEVVANFMESEVDAVEFWLNGSFSLITSRKIV